jgi:hypothetical protein
MKDKQKYQMKLKFSLTSQGVDQEERDTWSRLDALESGHTSEIIAPYSL